MDRLRLSLIPMTLLGIKNVRIRSIRAIRKSNTNININYTATIILTISCLRYMYGVHERRGNTPVQNIINRAAYRTNITINILFIVSMMMITLFRNQMSIEL